MRLDGWINLEMDQTVATKVMTLRPAIDALIVRGTSNPEQITEPSHIDEQVRILFCYFPSLSHMI